MTQTKADVRAVVSKNGPYIVTGNVPLSTQTIVAGAAGGSESWKEKGGLPQADKYALCRCGRSKRKPFCDGSHISAQLKAICTYMLPEVSSLQTGPLVVDGTMYFTTDEGSYAIDASTCAEKWKQHRHSDTPSMLLVNRGFAYTNGRLFRGTSDSHVLAMDPADGHQIWDHVLDVQGPGVSIPMAPIAAS